MSERLYALMGEAAADVLVSTFHAYFYRILRSYYRYDQKGVLSEDERYGVIRGIISNIDEDACDAETVKDYSTEISVVKNELIDISYHNPIALPAEMFRSVYKSYEQWKESAGRIDFDDMLTGCLKLLRENPGVLLEWQNRYSHITIDEFQDVNRTQYEIIRLLADKHRNIFAVGDDDQSIYRFRGSRPEYLLNFDKDFPGAKRIVLGVNYRSTNEIIDASAFVISHNKRRIPKDISGTGRNGVKPVLISTSSARLEAAAIAEKILLALKKISPREIAVLYRTVNQARPLLDAFMDYGISFFIRDDAPTVYDHWITADILAYLRLAADNMNIPACERIINKPNRYIPAAVIKAAKKGTGSLLSCLYSAPNIQNWQKGKLEDLLHHLKLMKKMKPYDAIEYLFTEISYGEYLKKYAEFRKMNIKNLSDLFNEIKESAYGHATSAEFISHIEAAREKIRDDKKAKSLQDVGEEVTLSTIHGVKGLEYEAVFIAGVIDGVIPHEKSKTAADLEEECRLLYVGCTRAKNYLFLSEIDLKLENDLHKSPYIKDMDKNLYKEEIIHENKK